MGKKLSYIKVQNPYDEYDPYVYLKYINKHNFLKKEVSAGDSKILKKYVSDSSLLPLGS